MSYSIDGSDGIIVNTGIDISTIAEGTQVEAIYNNMTFDKIKFFDTSDRKAIYRPFKKEDPSFEIVKLFAE